MGEFSSEAIDEFEESAELEKMSYHATEVSHLREVIDGQGKQMSVALTAVKELHLEALAVQDGIKYYGEMPTAEFISDLITNLTRIERTLK